MTRAAHSLVSHDLLDKLMRQGMVDGLPVSFGDNLYQVKIQSDHLPREGYNGQVQIAVDSTCAGGFLFRPDDYDGES